MMILSKIRVWLVVIGFCGGWAWALPQNSPQKEIPEDVKAEIAKLHSSDPVTRTLAAYSLREKKTRALAAIPDLIWLLADDTPLKWSAGRETSPGEEAAQALGYEMGKAAFEPLLGVLGDKNPVVRERAIWALSEIAMRISMDTKTKFSPPRAVQQLLAALKDSDANVQLTAAWALRTVNDKRAVAPLIAVLQDRSLSRVKFIPRGFVSRLGEQYVNARELAASALGDIGDLGAFEPLLVALDDADPLVRRQAPQALGSIKDPRAFKPLLKLTSDKDHRVVAAAVRGLELLGDRRAINPLVAMLKDEKRDHFSLDESDIDRNIETALEKLTGKDFKAICKEYDVKESSTLVNIAENPFTAAANVPEKQPAPPPPPPAASPVPPKQKIIIQGTIRYQSGTPVMNRRFYLVEVNSKDGTVVIRSNQDGSAGIASAVTDEKGYFKAEADAGRFVRVDTPYTLIAFPGDNRKEKPFAIHTEKKANLWFTITPGSDIFDFDRSGGAIFSLKKKVELSSALGFSSLVLSAFRVNFYESGYEGTALEQRVYKNEFIDGDTRYVYWELNLDYEDPGSRIEFTIEAVWTGPDGRELTRQNFDTYTQAGWQNSWHCLGWGNDTPGAAWEPGLYSVELKCEGRRIVKASFKVL
jgi:HEAT repeat protein